MTQTQSNAQQNIATTCQSCGHAFSVTRTSIQTFTDGITNCPACKTPIQFTFCPHCHISYSIALKNLQPNKYVTTCKRCATQFTITVPSLPRQEQSDRSSIKEEKPKPPFIERVAVPAVDTDRQSKRGQQPVRNDTDRRHHGSHRAASLTQQTGNTPAHSSVKKNMHPGRTETAPGGNTARKETARSDIPSDAIPSPIAVDAYKKSYYTQKAFRQFGLKDLAVSFAKHLTLSAFLVSAGTLLCAVLAAFLLQRGISAFIDFSQLHNTYTTSFFRIIPILSALSICMAGSTVIARSVQDTEDRNRTGSGEKVLLFLRVLGISVIAGAPALYAINVLLVFLARIPAIGSLLFALLFLPIYTISLATVIVTTTGIWFLPPLFASQRGGVGHALYDFFSFMKRYNLRLLYIVPTLFLLGGAVSGISLLLHGSALSLLRIISLTIAGEPVTEAFAGLPVLFTRISELSTFGANRNLLYYLAGGDTLSQAGGTLIGIVLVTITAILYSFAFLTVSLAAARMHLLLEKDIDTGDRAKRQLFTVLLLVYASLMLMKLLIL